MGQQVLGWLTSTGGEVQYPDYIVAQYKEWLNSAADPVAPGATFNISDDIVTARNNSPYALVQAHDPDPYLADVSLRQDLLNAEVDIFDPETSLADAVNAALTAYDDSISSPTHQAELLASTWDTMDDEFQRELGMITAGYLDTRSMLNSQLGVSLAMAGMRQYKAKMDFQAKLVWQTDRERSAFILNLTDATMRAKVQKLQANQTALATTLESSRMQIVAKQDQINYDLDYESKDLLWNLDLYDYAHRGLSSIAGTPIPRGQTRAERMLGALTTSIPMGIQLGMTMGPEAGIAVGGVMMLGQMLTAALSPS